MTSDITLANYAAQVPVMAGGNTEYAARYGRELRKIVVLHAKRQPRSTQRELGPSELGHQCDQAVVSKMCGTPATNNVIGPWASLMGTWGHAGLEQFFRQENAYTGTARWIPEQKVRANALANHPGTADLYDAQTKTLVDHKFLGKSSMAKLMAQGPPRYYFVQMIIYGQGYMDQFGLQVNRVILAAWPRTSSDLDDMYCWEWPWVQAEADAILREVAALTAARKEVAKLVMSRQFAIDQVRRTPGEYCIFCTRFRPQSALDNGPGCPGSYGEKLAGNAGP